MIVSWLADGSAIKKSGRWIADSADACAIFDTKLRLEIMAMDYLSKIAATALSSFICRT
jgi:hypothetical protein